ncbi:Protein PSK SIMULATOR 1 [Linum perenne]
MGAESWFRNLLKIPKKHEFSQEKVPLGVLALEVASLMSKVVHLWHALSDKQISRLREEITTSVGISKLVSEDDDFIVRLICAEMMDSVVHVAKSVARLGKKCSDPTLKSFEAAFHELVKIGVDQYGWQFSLKKMDTKVKKMERFISINGTLYQEMELLVDLEQTVRRMKCSEPIPDSFPEYQKKLRWKQHEVKDLREMSLWSRTYDYTVGLLVRSLFTIFVRINHVFGFDLMVQSRDPRLLDADNNYSRQSVSTILQSSVHQSESRSTPRFSSGPLGMHSSRKSGPLPKLNKKKSDFYSGPIGGGFAAKPAATPSSGKKRGLKFFSGPLGKQTSKSGPSSKSGPLYEISKLWQTSQPSASQHHSKHSRFTQVGPFKGCMVDSTNSSSVVNCHILDLRSGILDDAAKEGKGDHHLHQGRSLTTGKSIFSTKFVVALPETLGATALALHYANVIIVIEKLAASPHLISHDARDDLYSMLPGSVRITLRQKLKPYAKSLASSAYDSALAREWTEAIASILEWLSPLAHNMIRWQTERSFEQQNFVSRTNVFLVQTLFYANQGKTEATIAELLVGLNYLWRSGREPDAKAARECATGRTFDECLELDD